MARSRNWLYSDDDKSTKEQCEINTLKMSNNTWHLGEEHFQTYQGFEMRTEKHTEYSSYLQYKARLSLRNPKLGWRMHPACLQRREDTLTILAFLWLAQ